MPTNALLTVASLPRILQFLVVLPVLGIYGQDLHSSAPRYPPKTIYAELVAALSAITALLYLIPAIGKHGVRIWWWDALLGLAWLILFGLFSKKHIHNRGDEREKVAVWIDLLNLVLWVTTAVWGFMVFWRRGRRSRFTGRAEV